jgi:hypothetical protein
MLRWNSIQSNVTPLKRSAWRFSKSVTGACGFAGAGASRRTTVHLPSGVTVPAGPGAGAAAGWSVGFAGSIVNDCRSTVYRSNPEDSHRGADVGLPPCNTSRGGADPSEGTTNVCVRVLLSASTRVPTVKVTQAASGEIATPPADFTR